MLSLLVKPVRLKPTLHCYEFFIGCNFIKASTSHIEAFEVVTFRKFVLGKNLFPKPLACGLKAAWRFHSLQFTGSICVSTGYTLVCSLLPTRFIDGPSWR
jgi:hypothetical protein